MSGPIPDDLQEFLQSEDLKAYLGSDYPKWLPRFTRLLEKRPKIGGMRSAFSWNWMAFLVALIYPPGWFFLNKSWFMAWLLMVLSLLSAFMWPVGGFLALIAIIFAGREASNAKLVAAHKAVKKARQSFSDDATRRAALQGTGKNSWGAVWGTFVIYALIVGMVAVAQDMVVNPDAYSSASSSTQSSSRSGSSGTCGSGYSRVDVYELNANPRSYAGRNIEARGHMTSMMGGGVSQGMLSPRSTEFTNFTIVKFNRLSSTDRSNIARRCGSGCRVTVCGRLVVQTYETYLAAESVRIR